MIKKSNLTANTTGANISRSGVVFVRALGAFLAGMFIYALCSSSPTSEVGEEEKEHVHEGAVKES